MTYADFQEGINVIPTSEDPTLIQLDYHYDHITTADGLPHYRVYWISQDSRGFLWIATEGGFSRYDGYQFKTYQHDPDNPSSLSSNQVYEMLESSFKDTSYLWIRTLRGLDRLNLLSEEITHFSHNMDDINSLSGEPRVLAGGDNHSVWIGTHRGLDRFEPVTRIFQHFLPDIDVSVIHPDQKGHIWLGTDEETRGLILFDPSIKKVVEYRHDSTDHGTISGMKMKKDFVDSEYFGNEYLWIGTASNGINLFHTLSGRVQRFQTRQPNSNRQAALNFESKANGRAELWFTTYPYAYMVLDLQTGRFAYDRHQPNNPFGLITDQVLYMFEDQSEVIWLATWAGLERLNRFSQVFKNIDNTGSNSLISERVTALFLDSRNRLWIGGQAGFCVQDLGSGKIENFNDHPLCTKRLREDMINAFAEDEQGNMWILGLNGLYLLDRNWQYLDCIQLSKSGHQSNKKPFTIMNDACIDSKGNVWIVSRNYTSVYYSEIDSLKHGLANEQNEVVLNPSCGDSGWILLGSRYVGLLAYNINTGVWFRYQHDDASPASISANRIYELYESSDGILWIGTNGGLDYTDISCGFHDSLEFHHYTIDDGLSDNVVLSIEEDQHGRLWIATQNGLSCFNHETGIFRNYDEGDGLISASFYPRASDMDSRGNLYFGSMKGLIVFHPDSLRDNPYIPPVQLTQFNVFHEPALIKTGFSKKHHTEFYLPKSITYLDTLNLSYRENVFSLEFAALDFRNPQKNQYAYMLEGFDNDWVYTDASNRVATYTNLDPGKYKFQVKGSNNDGIWNDEGRSLTIIITPPWWETGWAYLGYILITVGVLIGAWRIQVNRLKINQQLEMEHFEADRLREMDSLKSRFFANISHEFRTPLTLILGPIDKLRNRFRDKESQKDLSLMQKHARRLLNLVSQLLDLSKLEARKMTLKASAQDIIPLIRGLVQSFVSLADRKGISLSFQSESDNLELYFQKDIIVKIMNNLLSNAFKFTQPGNSITVKVFTSKQNTEKPGNLMILVTDTGIGIPADRLETIFDRFYQVDGSHTRKHEGTGIGLSLTKELVELHKGNITVESEEGAGSTFIVCIPLGKDHLDENEIVESTPEVDIDNIDADLMIDIDEEPVDKKDGNAIWESTWEILIVEDNADVRRYIREYLEHDYHIIEAINGEEGIIKAIQKIPDLIISDIMMPVMDGVEFCRKIRSDERTSHIPVILLTAKADMDDKLDGLETGADDYLTKPFNARELQVRIKNLIKQRHRLQDRFKKEFSIIPDDISLTSLDEQFLNKVVEIIRQNLSNSEFKVDDFAHQVYMSRQHLNRKLKALTGFNPGDFIRSIRLKTAAQLLQQHEATITEIAYQVGFSSPSRLSDLFHQEFGCTPTQYSQNHLK